MPVDEEKLKHLGADLDSEFVLKFRDYCATNDFKQKTLLYRLVDFWLQLDPIAQEHIYRNRLDSARDGLTQIALGQQVVSRASSRTKQQTRKPRMTPSKAQ